MFSVTAEIAAFLAEIAAFLSAGATVVLTIITGWYAWLTRRILQANVRAVEAANEQAELNQRPYIIISPFAVEGEYYLRVRNTGRSPAEQLKLDLDTSFHRMDQDDWDLASSGLFSNGVEAFAPDSEIVYTLGSGAEIFDKPGAAESQMPLQFRVTANYWWGEKHYNYVAAIDLGQYKSTIQYLPKELQEQKKTRQALEKVATEVQKAVAEIKRLG